MNEDHNEDHWAWARSSNDFYPLGDEKLANLMHYIFTADTIWRDKKTKKILEIEYVMTMVKANRKYASQMYTVFKIQIEAMIEAKKMIPAKPKKKTVTKRKVCSTKAESPVTAVVLSLCEFKKRKAG